MSAVGRDDGRFGVRLRKALCRLVNVPRRRALEREWLPRLRQDREQVEREQVERLRSLLRHAHRTVPYYRDVFRAAGFDPEEVRSPRDIESLPVLTKEIIRREGPRMVSEDFPPSRLMEKSTGGSTGEPLVFYRHREYLDAALKGTFRNYAQCGWRPGDPVANFWGVNDPQAFRARALKEEINLGVHTFDAFRAGEAAFAGWLRRMEAIVPVVFYGYASTVWLFCRWLDAARPDRRALRRLRGVYLTAERLEGFQRRLIEGVLGVPVFSLYGSTEIQNIAFECPAGSLHVASDFAVVEVEGGTSGPGPLLLTSLRNFAMPFLRYRNGDEGAVLAAPCGCGIRTPCLSLDISRGCDHFRTRSGRLVHGEFFTHLMEGIRGVKLFQFRQTAPDAVRLLLVADGGPDEALRGRIASVAESVRRKTDEELGLQVEWVDAIPPSARGKHRFTISEVE